MSKRREALSVKNNIMMTKEDRRVRKHNYSNNWSNNMKWLFKVSISQYRRLYFIITSINKILKRR